MTIDTDILRLSLFSQFPEFVHAISTRPYGSIKEREAIYSENLNRLLGDLGIPKDGLVLARQVHGKEVAVVTNTQDQLIQNVDGLLTKHKGVFLGMTTADCLPVMFYDPVQRITGVAHAGFRGVLGGVIEEMIARFVALGSKTEDMYVGIAPGIGVCCYNVEKERIALFDKKFSAEDQVYELRDNTYYLDIKRAAEVILLKGGIAKEKIEISPLCTKDTVERFFSYRGSDILPFGEFLTLVGLV